MGKRYLPTFRKNGLQKLMANIDKFISHLSSRGEVSKPSKFDVMINAPFLLESMINASRDLMFQCEASELPGSNINTVDGRIYGENYPVASLLSYNDLTLTFICNGVMSEKRFFETWINGIIDRGEINRQANYLLSYHDQYVSTITVTQYSEYGDKPKTSFLSSIFGLGSNPEFGPSPIYRAVFLEAFPYSIQPIPLNWSDDGISRLNVSFKYTRWLPDDRVK
jgi:hypothetical protein